MLTDHNSKQLDQIITLISLKMRKNGNLRIKQNGEIEDNSFSILKQKYNLTTIKNN